MPLSPTLIDGGRHVLTFSGAVGVAGSPVDLDIDLTALPQNVREDPKFRDQLFVLLEAEAPAGVTDVDKDAATILPAAPALPETLRVPVTSTSIAAGISARIEMPHTVSR